MNTYFELCTVLCLGIFSLVLLAGSVAADVAAGLLGRFRFGNRLLRSPALLFALRMFPFAFSSFLTLGLALPAFLLLEPRQTGEAPELYLIVLASLSVMGFATVGIRLLRVLSATTQISSEWQQRAERIHIAAPIPVFRVEAPASLFAVAGVVRQRVFIGGEALACLTPEEVNAAIAHELAHVRSFDNLKRLALSISRLPRWLSHLESIDAAWSEAVELAADEEALKSSATALELGSAIVKIGRLHSTTMPSIAACHLVMSDKSSALAMRLARLRFLLDHTARTPARSSRLIPARVLLISIILGYLFALPAALALTHRAMEWLVR